MKILVKMQEGWGKKLKCTGDGNDDGEGCGSLLLVEKDDVFRTSRQSYGDSYPEYFNTFRCPVCHVRTDIKGKLPFEPRASEQGADNS